MSAEDPGSVTNLFGDLKAGSPDAADALWKRYFTRLVVVARKRLIGATHQAVEDAEDAALSAFNGFCTGAVKDQFDNLADRADLWRLLVAITINKALEQRRRHGRKKRGGDLRLINAADLAPDQGDPIGDQVDSSQTPESAMILQDQFVALLDALQDPVLKQVAIWRMNGLVTEEIAERMGCVVRTVERKIERIRLIWQEQGLNPND